MKRRLKEPFGKAGLTVAVCAIVLALVGGAYAAGGLTKSLEKQVTKIAKRYAGKPGAPGATGPAGANGTNGKDGASGKDGTNGKDVTGVAIPAGLSEAKCNHQGGTAYTSATGTENVCNGKEGSPWTAGGTLPSGASEQGIWAGIGQGFSAAPISFGIPLKTEPAINYLKKGEGETAQCPGTAAEPEAKPGNLCIYTAAEELEGEVLGFFSPEGKSGARGLISGTNVSSSANGPWVVTAE
jgi:hypothetical protein